MCPAVHRPLPDPNDRLTRASRRAIGGDHRVANTQVLHGDPATGGADARPLGEARHRLHGVAVDDAKRSRGDAGAEDDAVDPARARAGSRVRERQRVAVADAEVRQRATGDDELIPGFPRRHRAGEPGDVVQPQNAGGVLKHHVDHAVVDGIRSRRRQIVRERGRRGI